jgi:hypothetical protein
MNSYIVLDCKQCSHHAVCTTPCIYVDTLANGNIGRVEPLISNIIDNADIPDTRDYDSVLADLADDRIARIEYALSISDIRCRAIASMILANIPRHIIAGLLGMSYRHISRIINNNNQLRAIKRVKTA